MIFGSAQTCSFLAVFRLPVRILTIAVSAIYSDMRKNLYRAHQHFYILCPKLQQWHFFSNHSAIYTKWCTQTFPPIFGLFAIFDHNFVNIVVPSSDENENCVALLKGWSLLKKCRKPHENWSINCNTMIVRTMHPVECTACQITAWQEKK